MRKIRKKITSSLITAITHFLPLQLNHSLRNRSCSIILMYETRDMRIFTIIIIIIIIIIINGRELSRPMIIPTNYWILYDPLENA